MTQADTEQGAPTPECPLPLTHDRFEEAHWHLHQMLQNYHHPATFRYATNAFLHALKSVMDMLRVDLERAGKNEWRKNRLAELRTDPIFAAFARGRDIVMHQGALIQASRVEIGLMRGTRVKLAIQRDLKTDEPSHSLLARLIQMNGTTHLFVEPDHPFIGEQLGVKRTYFEPQLSGDQDVVTAAHLAWMATGQVLSDAHELFGIRIRFPRVRARFGALCRTCERVGRERSGSRGAGKVGLVVDSARPPADRIGNRIG